ncbi:peptidyl-tRNA hydrolase domain-containing protein 1 [Sparganum proliferum]
MGYRHVWRTPRSVHPTPLRPEEPSWLASRRYSYLEDLENMHKVVLAIEEAELPLIADKLTGAGVDFVTWREQPENILTAIALRPYAKNEVQSYFKGLRLLS